MYALVQGHEYRKFEHLLDQSFRLRKRVFADRLGWDVSVSGPHERDFYDDLSPAYLLWCDDGMNQLYGSLRLMPTTGPTLLYDVFRDTFPDASSLIAPGIWEGTRMCIDEELVVGGLRDLTSERAFCMLLLALCEVALDNGIHTMISNYEPHMRRIYRRAGAQLDELGRADGYGRFPVCCGAFEVSQNVLLEMRRKMAISEPLYTPRRFRAESSERTYRSCRAAEMPPLFHAATPR